MPAEPCLGIVDWGIGGVGLLTHLDRLAPGLPVLYWSDAGVTPYGRMGADELAGRLTSVVAALARRGATEVVLACNAASTVADRLNTAVPVEGIIGHGVASVPDDAVCVAVVGGRRTIAAGHYRRGLARPGRTVVSRVAQPLSAHIEAGRTGSPRFQADLDRIIAPLRQADALVLACTHYPAAARWFAAALPHARLVDPAAQLAAAVAARYPRLRQPGPAPRHFVTTGDPQAMRRSAAHAWGTVLTATAVERLQPPARAS
ncbi:MULTISPECIES: glutamate racemase [Mycobacterium]|uniref:Glutamate racemase n=1 Tax=Mycobacterium kiyosense TaxID=2871094 RepID=A0A9P3Q5K7_9MYCO|nr:MULTISPECIES: aspartate/glutamate racemase family protein [Mycobacterium]BDB41865.1 glutamate racemase [Mycobacterium kiyosense]BDE14842.1 glutamate racemase [Mycobacterium sp. 20KCMC460]GLB82216.1 glutamate racemase [Mycobacterium kiyosense]GLB89266.1 glutamate racemase [Mycobacterium kiyosense]GLB95920.1 glutamate racemase [Mycobacterium kiyosense]